MKAYLIPGLGFDERIFQKLQFNGIEIAYLNWIEPTKNEPLKSYARRMARDIGKSAGTLTLIGHSFGGIMAQEIAEIFPVKKIILISSIKSRQELPFHFKVVAPIGVHHCFSKKMVAKTIKYWGKYYDYVTREEQSLVADMINAHSNHFLRWALKQLSIWQGSRSMTEVSLLHIHGELDKTFPIRLVDQPVRTLPGAGHFMVFNQPEQISGTIMSFLSGK